MLFHLLLCYYNAKYPNNSRSTRSDEFDQDTIAYLFDHCPGYSDLRIYGGSSLISYIIPPLKSITGTFDQGKYYCFEISKGFVIGLQNNNNVQAHIFGRDGSGNYFSAYQKDKPFGAACPDDETCQYIILPNGTTNYILAYGITTKKDIDVSVSGLSVVGTREPFLILKDFSCSIGTYASYD